jgi:hypothetical protein
MRHRLRSTFTSYKQKVAEVRREEYIEGKVFWFR